MEFSILDHCVRLIHHQPTKKLWLCGMTNIREKIPVFPDWIVLISYTRFVFANTVGSGEIWSFWLDFINKMDALKQPLTCLLTLNLEVQGVLALCEFHYCEFHYCGFSKLSRYISKNLANAISWAISFVTAYVHG